MGRRRVCFLNIWRFNAIVESPSYLINSLTLHKTSPSLRGICGLTTRRQRIGISRGDGDNMAGLFSLPGPDLGLRDPVVVHVLRYM